MAWWTLLSGMDAWMLGRVVVAAGFYGAALLAVGSRLFRFAFPDLPRAEGQRLERTLVAAAWTAILLALLSWPLQAGFLGGGSLAAARDPVLRQVVIESPLGDRLRLALAGLLLLQANLLSGRLRALAPILGLAGVVLVLLAFTRVGHTRGDPLLGALLFAHLGLAAFWLASLAPLYRLAGNARYGDLPSRLLGRFGWLGQVLIPLLLLAGASLAGLLMGGLAPLLHTPYGQLLLIKLSLVTLLLLLGALNKWWLVPALARGVPGAGQRLRSSIATEGTLIGLILLTVALLTATTSPLG